MNNTSQMKVKKIDHVVITTAKEHDCISFYERLGFVAKKGDNRYELFAGDFKLNVHILGKELTPHAKNVQTGSVDLCFEIDGSMDTFKGQLVENGIDIELGIVERTGVKGKMRSVYLRDPDENLVEFCSYE